MALLLKILEKNTIATKDPPTNVGCIWIWRVYIVVICQLFNSIQAHLP